MKNVTITLDEETARWARIEAAKRDMSVSRLIRDLLRQNMRQNRSYEVAMRRWLSRPPYIIDEPGAPLPTRDELHDRPGPAERARSAGRSATPSPAR